VHINSLRPNDDRHLIVMIVLRFERKIIRTVLCCIVYELYVNNETHKCDQFSNLHAVRFRFRFCTFVYVCVCVCVCVCVIC